MIALLGIDDTDDDSSRGTGHQARQLGKLLREEGIAEVHAITRHQLLVDSRIDYTSRNSSACLVLEPTQDEIASLLDLVRKTLKSSCAPSSNAGVCLSELSAVRDEIQDFGRAAKNNVLTVSSVRQLAEQQDMYLEGINGNGAGIIGALAAIGLHAAGNDGRFIWLPKLRELDGGFTVEELSKLLGVGIETASGEEAPSSAKIQAAEWMRPIMRDGRAILVVEWETQNRELSWRFADKQTIKALSD